VNWDNAPIVGFFVVVMIVVEIVSSIFRRKSERLAVRTERLRCACDALLVANMFAARGMKREAEIARDIADLIEREPSEKSEPVLTTKTRGQA
jgi:hypothetical protein